MASLLSAIFGDVRYDDSTNAYYWHPWVHDDQGQDLTEKPKPTDDE